MAFRTPAGRPGDSYIAYLLDSAIRVNEYWAKSILETPDALASGCGSAPEPLGSPLDSGPARRHAGGMSETAAWQPGGLEAEVLVVGGGLVGLTLGIALAEAGLEVLLVDAQDPAEQRDAAHDGRASAIARGSQQALESAGLWPAMAAEAQPILEIRVSDGQVGRAPSPFFLHYDREQVDGQPLGCMVEKRVTRRALHARAAAQASIVIGRQIFRRQQSSEFFRKLC